MSRKKSGLPVWCRLSAEIQHDEDFLDLSMPAMTVFLLSIPIAKERRRDGEISLRDFVSVFVGKLDLTDLEQIAMELVESGFWLSAGGMRYIVRSFTRWNESQDEQAELRERKRIGALRTNHTRWGHETPVAGCPLCETPGSAPEDRSSDRSSDRSGVADSSLDGRRENETGDPNPSTSRGTDSDSAEGESSGKAARRQSELALAKQLCEEFADHRHLVCPDDPRPKVLKAWVTEMDRMLRLDKRTEVQVRGAIGWLQTEDGSFWNNQVRCVPKLREEFSRLRDEKRRREAVARARQERESTQHSNGSDWQAAHSVALAAYRGSRRAGSPPMAELLAGQPAALIEAALANVQAWKTLGEKDAKFAFKDHYDAAVARSMASAN